MTGKVLGLLELENRPLDHPGALSASGTFDFPVRRLTVPGASTRSVVDGDPAVREAYIGCARQLDGEGVSAIIANCGFSSLLQDDVSAAVSAPVALSSLMLVPFVARTLPAGRKVGIVTYDAERLEERHFEAAGWSSRETGISIVGIEGTRTWRQLAEPVPEIEPAMLVGDVTAAVTHLLKADPAVAALVFECAAFPLAADAIRAHTGLPVADYVTLARTLVDMSPRSARPR